MKTKDRLIGVECRICLRYIMVTTSVQGIFPLCPHCSAPVSAIPTEPMWRKAMAQLDREKVDPALLLAYEARKLREEARRRRLEAGRRALFMSTVFFVTMAFLTMFVRSLGRW